MENRTHSGNYKGTTHMNAENQDMEFANDTLELAEDKRAIRNKDKLNTQAPDAKTQD
ncbi:hypothetical protein [Paenibacillus chitinolyticus]|uniref:YfhD family protein n=1 Tax=Paenibacillus chitinolyticus TaxID=79263 RepID=A0ABT4FMZ5_9BACL|nr:hypothetical protein [Paenibacillus chitinolyticus]MCY9590737.1 hypothetical protein [Paenibacillus chitinolyticus]MCY9599898.1 hypothetical protein [Paenibacillus chitinolyticus]